MAPLHRQPGHLLALLELAGEREERCGTPASCQLRGGSDESTLNFSTSTELFEALRCPATETGSTDKEPLASPGRRLGPYHLICRLGRGSEGEVWEAVRASGGLRAVAMKVLRPHLSEDPLRRAAFLRAAELSRSFKANELLAALDSGEDEGFVYMSMPLINGPTLSQVIADQWDRVRPDHYQTCEDGHTSAKGGWWLELGHETYAYTVARAIARMTRGLATAHAKGVAHRDIKPSNILIDRECPGRALLGDFGSATRLSGGDPYEQYGWGTLPYMPPERLLNRKVNPVLGDIFAIGVTLYEAITLRHPRSFPAKVPRSCLPAYFANADPIPLHDFCPWLSRRLEAVVLRAMAYQAEDRHPSAINLADEIEEACATTSASEP